MNSKEPLLRLLVESCTFVFCIYLVFYVLGDRPFKSLAAAGLLAGSTAIGYLVLIPKEK